MGLFTTLKIFLAYAIASISIGVLVGVMLIAIGFHVGWWE